MTPLPENKLILASGSAIRTTLLREAGVAFDVQKIALDEERIKGSLLSEKAPARDIAHVLAGMKALRANTTPDHYVIGADQVLVCEGELLSKATNRATLKNQLCQLRGKPHQLISAVCVAQNKHVLWHHVDSAHLTMRDFSNAFLDTYLEQHENDIMWSVGGYQLEGPGIQLFSQIKGDYFTILGLPLLPLLDFLRLHRCIAT